MKPWFEAFSFSTLLVIIIITYTATAMGLYKLYSEEIRLAIAITCFIGLWTLLTLLIKTALKAWRDDNG